jgi:hypothetical protein
MPPKAGSRRTHATSIEHASMRPTPKADVAGDGGLSESLEEAMVCSLSIRGDWIFSMHKDAASEDGLRNRWARRANHAALRQRASNRIRLVGMLHDQLSAGIAYAVPTTTVHWRGLVQLIQTHEPFTRLRKSASEGQEATSLLGG